MALFHTDIDRSEARDIAAEHPDKVEELKKICQAEAEKYNVLPLNSYPMTGPGVMEFFKRQYHVGAPRTGRYTYYPGTSEVPEHSAANTHRSFKIVAEVDLHGLDASGVIFAQGSRFGGHAMFVKDRNLYYVYNFLGIGDEQTFTTELPQPGKHIFGVEFTVEGADQYNQPTGTTKLHIDEQVVDEGPMRIMFIQYSLCGEGLSIGYDAGDAVSRVYKPTFKFSGGEIVQVVFDVADETYEDPEHRLAALVARD